MNTKRLLSAFVVFITSVCCCVAQAASRAPVAAENGMVVTAQHLATHVGVDVLKSGGNAVDAAVAVGYALAVTYPAAGNLGGGGFMTIQFADGRKTFLDFREKAPLRAAANMYLDIKPDVAAHEGSNTTHYSIADRFGNAVAVTYTLNEWFGARVTAGGTGVLLNNEMDDFTAKVGVPNLFGLVQGEANSIAPGKRPLSSMCPTIVTRDGKPLLVLGTPGGSRIITAVLLTMLNVIDYGMDVQEAVDAPRFHQQWLPEASNVEEFALSPDTRKILTQMGHELSAPHPVNHVAAIMIGAPALDSPPVGKNRYYGAIDPRRNTGLALGY